MFSSNYESETLSIHNSSYCCISHIEHEIKYLYNTVFEIPVLNNKTVFWIFGERIYFSVKENLSYRIIQKKYAKIRGRINQVNFSEKKVF
jgi:hypothetical protein